jgi:hypothetical protein
MEDLRLKARALLRQEDLALVDLWIPYWSNGGDCDPFEFDAFIHEMLPITWFDLNALAWAIEELNLETAEARKRPSTSNGQ